MWKESKELQRTSRTKSLQTKKQNCRPRYKEYKKILKTLDWSFSEQPAISGL